MHPWVITLYRGASQSAVRRSWVSLCTVWAAHSQWPSEQISFITTMRLSILQLLCRLFVVKHHITQVCQTPYSPDFGSLRLLVYPKAKIAFEREEICEWDGHTVQKLSQRRLTADWLAPRYRVITHGCTVRSPLTGCQVTSRPRDRFSRYSKWLNIFRTALVILWLTVTN